MSGTQSQKWKPALPIAISFLMLLIAIASHDGRASVVLPPGTSVTMRGTTLSAEPQLEGKVLHDALVPFAIQNSAGTVLYRGNLQNRVVQSRETGEFHFYYRIRDTASGPTGYNGTITHIQTGLFNRGPLLVDFRLDGLGSVGCTGAARDSTGAFVKLNFAGRGVAPGAESKFCFVAHGSASFRPGAGRTNIFLSTGESTTVSTVTPTYRL